MSPRSGLDLNTVLQAAAELADLHGLDHVTLAMLAKKLNIRTPSLYNHINGLPGLRSKLAVHGIELLQDAMTHAVVGRSGDEAVRTMSWAYIRFARNRPGLYAATVRAPDPQEPELALAAQRLLELCTQVLGAYGLHNDASLHAVRSLRSFLHGFASLEQLGGFGLPLDRDVTLTLLIDTFLAGLKTLQQGR